MSASHTPGPWFVTRTKDLLTPVAEIVTGGSPLHIRSRAQEGSAEADAGLIASAPDLLDELEKAHRIIRNALNIMTTDQKLLWADWNEHAGVAGDGVTRANEREAVINRARGQQS